jgi:hypothetical protein
MTSGTRRAQAHDADEAVKIAIEQYEVAPAFRDPVPAQTVAGCPVWVSAACEAACCPGDFFRTLARGRPSLATRQRLRFSCSPWMSSSRCQHRSPTLVTLADACAEMVERGYRLIGQVGSKRSS